MAQIPGDIEIIPFLGIPTGYLRKAIKMKEDAQRQYGECRCGEGRLA